MQRLPDKCTVRLRAGDVLRMLTPGGGGWGPPAAASVVSHRVSDRPFAAENAGRDGSASVTVIATELTRMSRRHPMRVMRGEGAAANNGIGSSTAARRWFDAPVVVFS